MSVIETLDMIIRETGAPIFGVALLNPGDVVEEGWDVVERLDGVRVRIDFAPSATEPQKVLARSAAFNADLRQKKERLLYAIYNDIVALSALKQAAVWSDLTSGNPAKLYLDAGKNAASIFVLQFLAVSVNGLNTAEKNEAKRRIAAFYVQDNPRYLVNPSFDNTINIPGDEPIT